MNTPNAENEEGEDDNKAIEVNSQHSMQQSLGIPDDSGSVVHEVERHGPTIAPDEEGDRVEKLLIEEDPDRIVAWSEVLAEAPRVTDPIRASIPDHGLGERVRDLAVDGRGQKQFRSRRQPFDDRIDAERRLTSRHDTRLRRS